MKRIPPSIAVAALVALPLFFFACSSTSEDDDPQLNPSSSSIADISGPGTSSSDVLTTSSPSGISSSGNGSVSSSSGGDVVGGSSSSGGDVVGPGSSSAGDDSSSSGDSGEVVYEEPVADGSVEFTNTNRDGIYFRGTVPAWTENVIITNAEAAACGEVTYDYKLDGSRAKVCAFAICDGIDKELLCSDEAIFVADPYIKSCSIASSVKVGSSKPIPSVVVEDIYNRCGAVTYSDYSTEVVKDFSVTAYSQCDFGEISKSCGELRVIATEPPSETQKLEFTGYGYKGNNINYSIGAIVNYNGIVIGNKTDADCGDVNYVETGFTKGSAAVNGTSSSIPIKVVATYTCGNGDIYKDSIEARIVPDPILSCSWESNSITAGGTATASVTVDKNYGRCTPSEVRYSNGIPKVIAAPGDVSGVVASLVCKNKTITAPCGDLTVNAAEPNWTGTLAFTNGYPGKAYRYYIGKTITHSAVSISNAPAAGCGPVVYDTTGTGSYDVNGKATGAGTIIVTAKSTCYGGVVQTYGSIEATIVPAWSLKSCTWTSSDVTAEGTAAFKVEVDNNYGRCTPTGAVFTGSIEGTQVTGTSPVTTPSIPGTLSGSAALTCGTETKTITCENLTVKAQNPNWIGALAFTNGYTSPTSRKHYYYIGKTVTFSSSVDISNAAQASCGQVAYDTTGLIGGVTTADSSTVKITPKAYCNGNWITREELAITATVVPDPTINTCSWTPSSIEAGETASLSVTVNNNYGRCTPNEAAFSGAPFTFSSPRTVQGGTVSLTCAHLNAPLTANCDNLTVTPITAKFDENSFKFTNGYEKDGVQYYFIGKTISYTDAVIINKAAGGCGDVSYSSISGPVDNNKVTTGEGTISITATASCSGNVEPLQKTITATVVDNPSMTCSWNESSIVAGGSATAHVTIANNYGRCDETSVRYDNLTFNAPGAASTTARLSCAKYAPGLTASCTGLTVTAQEPVWKGDLAFTGTHTGKTGTKRYFIGDAITYSRDTISNWTEAGCTGTVNHAVSGNTSGAGTVTLIASATCDGKSTTTDPISIAVAPDPIIETCTWTPSSIVAGGTAEPKVTVKNSYGRCRDDEASFNNVPASFGAPTTVQGVTANLTCTGRTGTNNLVLQTKACDDLEVSAQTPTWAAGDLAFTNTHSGIYYTNETIQHNTVSVSNDVAAGCAPVQYNIAGLTNENKTTVGTVTLTATAECTGGTITKTVSATVVADPTLTNCTINGSANDATVPEGTNVTVTADVANNYGRCPNATATINGVSGAVGGPYSITATWDCGDYSPAALACPTLTVTHVPVTFTGKVALNAWKREGGSTYWYYQGKTVTPDLRGVTPSNKACANLGYEITEGSELLDEYGNADAAGTIKVCPVCRDGGYRDIGGDETCETARITVTQPTASCVWKDGSGIEIDPSQTLSSSSVGNSVTAEIVYANSYGRCSPVVSQPLTLSVGSNNVTNGTLAASCGSLQVAAARCTPLTVAASAPVNNLTCNWSSATLGSYGYVKKEKVTATFGGRVDNTSCGTLSGSQVVELTTAIAAGGVVKATQTCDGVTYERDCPAIPNLRVSSCEYYFNKNNWKSKTGGTITSSITGPNVADTTKICLDSLTTAADLNSKTTTDANVKAAIISGLGSGRYIHFTKLDKNLNLGTTDNRHFINARSTGTTATTFTLDSLKKYMPEVPEGGWYMYVGSSSNTSYTYAVSGGVNYSRFTPEPAGNLLVSYDYPAENAFFKGFNVATVTSGSDIRIANASGAPAGSTCGPVSYELAQGSNANTVGPVTINAVATCGTTKHTLASVTGKVVEDPSISGTCVWSQNNIKEGIDPNPTPSGLSLANSYGRCGNLTDGALATTSYFLGNNNWPTASANPLSLGTYNVSGSVTCGGSAVTATCPALKVVDPNVQGANCDAYKGINGKTWNDICGGIDWDQVKWGVNPMNGSPDTDINSNPAGCYFITSISTGGFINKGSSTWKINGSTAQTLNSSSQVGANKFPAPIDGGYYIYFPTAEWARYSGTITVGTPYCYDGIHGLTCPTLPAEKSVGASIIAPIPICRSGDNAVITGWEDAPIWSDLQEATYNVYVNATCGNSAQRASCGTLNVVAGNVIPPCDDQSFKASHAPGYSGTCASIGIEDSYGGSSSCICRNGKDIYQNISNNSLACYGNWEIPNSLTYRMCIASIPNQ